MLPPETAGNEVILGRGHEFRMQSKDPHSCSSWFFQDRVRKELPEFSEKKSFYMEQILKLD